MNIFGNGFVYFAISKTEASEVYLLENGNFVVVANGIFAEEVEFDNEVFVVEVLVQIDVLTPERAAANRVGRFAVFFFVSGSQRQLVEEKAHQYPHRAKTKRAFKSGPPSSKQRVPLKLVASYPTLSRRHHFPR